MRRAGFNMVEVLIALVLVGIISISMVSFVNDHHQRYRLAVARADLARIAESIQLAEERSRKRVESLSEPAGGITSLLAPYLLEIPAADPWGNRFALELPDKVRYIPGPSGDPYAVDIGLGRLISAGPDGEINTPIGHDPPDTENDLVVDFRRKPWITYTAGNQIGLATADGATRQAIPATAPPATPPSYANLAISPDGSWYAAIKDGSSLVVGPIDETSRALRQVVPRPAGKQPELALDVNPDTFPLFYPNGSSLLFISHEDLYRYDIGLDRVVPLTSNGFFGNADAASGTRTRWSSARGSSYSFNSGSGGTYVVTISTDGKLAFSHPGDSASGIYLVSASGKDVKMIKGSVISNGLLPVAWVSTDTLIFMTNPSTGADKFFYKIRMDGRDQGLALHGKPIPTGISLPVPSPDGNLISFFSSDSQGAVLRTDGSGFVDKTADGLFNPFSYAAGINSNVVPVWSRDSRIVYFVGRDGTVVRLRVPQVAPFSMIVETMPKNAEGFTGLQPQTLELNLDETLCGLVSSNPPGLYIVPLLGPRGARTEMRTAVLAPGESPVVRWLDRQ